MLSFLQSKTVKQLKEMEEYRRVANRSHIRRKSGLCRELAKIMVEENKETTLIGCFTGIKKLDLIPLARLEDQDLYKILLVNSYFNSFSEYEPLWREKVLQRFGPKYIQEYEGSDWKSFYFRLIRRFNKYRSMLKILV